MFSSISLFQLIVAAGVLLAAGFNTVSPPTHHESTRRQTAWVPRQKLSEYGFFAGPLADLTPIAGVVPYELNTPLFSNYAQKLRFIQLPAGQAATYNGEAVFDFPVGTHIIKTFYYPHDLRQPVSATHQRTLLETRLLTRTESGWKALEYIWNDEQTEAFLEVAGGQKEVTWVHTDGSTRKLVYRMPNVNQCKGCHLSDNQLVPIGPSARQLNRVTTCSEGTQNQLTYWQTHGMLAGLPTDPQTIPRMPVWNDGATGSLDARARALLDSNCGHCHNPKGPANTSGLQLNFDEANPFAWGVFKTPVAAGRGSGNLRYDIQPGQPDQSIVVHRMRSTDPGVMMPEIGRQVVHEEGVKLIREWIQSLKPTDFAKKE